MKKIFLIIIYSVFLRFVLKIILGVRYINRSVLKRKKQFIIVANHNSHLDALTLLSALPYSIINNVHPVAASDYFGNSKVKYFLSVTFINALLIPRSRPEAGQEPDPIDIMCKKLSQGESLIFFPEGTRGEPEVMQRFKKGIGLILEKYPHIPVIPVYLEGLGKSLPKGESILVPFNSIAHFGNPVKSLSYSPEEITFEIENEILNLKKTSI